MVVTLASGGIPSPTKRCVPSTVVTAVETKGFSGFVWPQLLDALAGKLVEYKYDFKRLVRDICLSRTYQLSSVVNEVLAAQNATTNVRLRFTPPSERVPRPPATLPGARRRLRRWRSFRR